MSFSRRRLHVDGARPHSRLACGIVRRRPGCSKNSEVMSRRLCASAGLLRLNRKPVRTRRAVSTTAGCCTRASKAPGRPVRCAISTSTLVDIGGRGSACSGDFVWLTVMEAAPHTDANRAPANGRDSADGVSGRHSLTFSNCAPFTVFAGNLSQRSERVGGATEGDCPSAAPSYATAAPRRGDGARLEDSLPPTGRSRDRSPSRHFRGRRPHPDGQR